MNEQFDPKEPVDPIIRAQLTRRSAGPLPEDLELQVSRALGTEAAPRARFALPRIRLTAPRLAGASVGIALVAILVVALGAPALRGGPAASTGYPYDRALTTDQLVSLLAGPAPAINTTLVVTTTIDLRSDVCPMNRYPTAGVIHGVSPQICVMESGLPPQLSGASGAATSIAGTFAFRYLGGNVDSYLGLLGQITPSASGLAYSVTDEWPTDGKAFVVEGFLGAYSSSCMLSVSLASPGDVLNPSGDDPCWQNWLSADGSPAPTVYPASDLGGSSSGSSSGSGGGAPTTGVPMPADTSPSTDPTVVPRLPAPASAESAASSFDPLALYGKARFVEAGGMRQIDSVTRDTVHGTWVVRGVTAGCPGAAGYDSRGCMVWRILARVSDVLGATPSPSIATPSTTAAGYSPPPPATPAITGPLAPALTGIVGPGGRPLTAEELNGLWAADPSGVAGRLAIVTLNGVQQVVRIESDGTPSPYGPTLANNGSPSPLSAAPKDVPGQINQLVLVDAYLDWVPSLECDTPPYPSDSLCGAGALTSVLTSAPLASQGIGNPHIAPFPSGVYGFEVALGAYQIYGSSDPSARPIHDLFLLSGGVIVTRMVPTTPLTGSSGATGSAPTGLIGPNNAPLTTSQLEAVILTDQYRLNGRYVIDMRSICDGGADCSGIPPKAVADLIQPDGSTGLVGPLDLAPDGRLVWKVPQATATWDKRYIFIVDASISHSGEATYLSSDASAKLTAQAGAYDKFAPPGTGAGASGRGLYVVTRVDTGKTCLAVPTASGADCSPQVEILARLEVATLP
ncbi:MAG TPA: hypothetical protein VF337_11490 [Candidatus Limnocylindrales bacterium]